jgi:hypothetical protein
LVVLEHRGSAQASATPTVSFAARRDWPGHVVTAGPKRSAGLKFSLDGKSLDVVDMGAIAAALGPVDTVRAG